MKKASGIIVCAVSLLLITLFTGCASTKGEKVAIDRDRFTSRLILIASGSERLVKFEMPDNKLLPDTDAKAIKAATMNLSIYSGRRPLDGKADGTPVVTIKFDLLKNADKLVKGYDLMANEKELKVSAKQINEALSKNQYYYAKGEFEATVKEDKTVTKAITLYSNDTVYTPLAE